MQIAMHELKSGLSRYVARARAGELIEITLHDKLVARLVGTPAAASEGLARLIASGAVSWNGQTPALPVPVKLSPWSSGKSMSDMVIEDRG